MISAAHPKTGDRSYAPALAAPSQQPRIAQGGNITPNAPLIGARRETQQIAPPERSQGGASFSEPAAMPPPLRAMDQAPEAPAADLRDAMWNRFLSAIGVDPDVANPRLHVQGLAEAASAAWNALSDHSRHNGHLGELLRSHQKTQESLLASEYEVMSHEVRGSRDSIDVLDEVDQTVRSFLPALMMFPENGLIAFIIQQLERAAQPDDGLLPGEQSLKDRLKSLQQDIAGLDLGAVESWRHISDWLVESLSAQSPQIVRLHQNNRRQQRG